MSKLEAGKTNASKRFAQQPCREKVGKETDFMEVAIVLLCSEVSLSLLQHTIAFRSRLSYACILKFRSHFLKYECISLSR